MGILDRFRRSVDQEEKAVNARIPEVDLISRRVGPGKAQPVLPDLTWRSLVQYGFKRNPLVNSAVTLYSQSASEPEMAHYVIDGDQKDRDDESPVRELLEHPNAGMSEDVFWSVFVANLMIGGTGYAWIEESTAGLPIGLWPMHIGQLAPVPSGRWIDWYEYDQGDNRPKLMVPARRVIQVNWSVDPANPYVGFSPIAAGVLSIEQDSGYDLLQHDLLQNGAMPATLITTKMPLDDDDAEEMRERWGNQHGARKRGGVGVIDGNEVSVQKMGAGLEDMNTEAVRRTGEPRVLMPFRIPPVLVYAYAGLEMATNRATVEWLDFAWHKDVLVPLWRRIGSAFEAKLFPYYGLDPKTNCIEFDLSMVESLKLVNVESLNALGTGLGAGGATRNDWRKAAGLEPDPTGDVYLAGKPVQEFGEEYEEPEPPPMAPSNTPTLEDVFGKVAKPAEKDGEDKPESKSVADDRVAIVRQRVADQLAIEEAMTSELARELERIGARVAKRIEDAEDEWEQSAVDAGVVE